MASTTAMFTGLSGLTANSRQLDVIGNNIANVNTHGFKSNRMMFSSTFSNNLSLGSSPSEFSGGVNPSQIGLGTSIAGTQRNFSNGAISATGVLTDLAIEGDGFFIVQQGEERFYTRAGAFQRNEQNELVTTSGARVKGYAVNDQFEIIAGQLVDISIPVGTLTLAQATRNVIFNGNLNAAGNVATTGSTHTTAAMFSNTDLDQEIDGTEDLTNLGTNIYIDDGDGNDVLALEGGVNTIITISGIEKNGTDLGTFTFGFMDDMAAANAGVDGNGSTLNDFVNFLETVLGLDDNDLGGGISIDAATGQIIIEGNHGTAQDLNIQSASFTGTSNTDNAISQPFSITRTGDANGESVGTSFIVYDSLGTPMSIDLSFVLQNTVEGQGTIWQFIAESSDNDALDRIIGTGLVEFDENGTFISATDDTFSVIRENGAESPLNVTINFDSGTNSISALTDEQSNVAAVSQDGSPIGTLSSFAVQDDGTIAGSFTNGLTRTIGQVAIATFSNPEGLIDAGNNKFRTGPNSGNPLVTTPTSFGTGRIIGGALELSNVDLSQEFINMIQASTGYSASSRVISTTNELIQQLLALGR